MKQLFAARFAMVEACINTAESFAPDWEGFEGFTQPFSELKALVPQMITAIGVNAQRIGPATQSKRSLRKEIEVETHRLSAALVAYSTKTRDDNLRSEARLKAYQLQQSSGNSLLGLATHRLALAGTVAENALAPLGFAPDALKEFASKVRAYALALTRPRDRRMEITTGQKDAEFLMAEAMHLLSDALDPAVVILSREHRSFSAQWNEARKVVRPAHRTRALSIAVSDAVSGAPVTGASIAILPAGVSRVSTVKGVAHVQNLVAGSYNVRVSHRDYCAKDVPFEVYPGETTVLAVVLNAA